MLKKVEHLANSITRCENLKKQCEFMEIPKDPMTEYVLHAAKHISFPGSYFPDIDTNAPTGD